MDKSQHESICKRRGEIGESRLQAESCSSWEEVFMTDFEITAAPFLPWGGWARYREVEE